MKLSTETSQSPDVVAKRIPAEVGKSPETNKVDHGSAGGDQHQEKKKTTADSPKKRTSAFKKEDSVGNKDNQEKLLLNAAETEMENILNDIKSFTRRIKNSNRKYRAYLHSKSAQELFQVQVAKFFNSKYDCNPSHFC